MFSPQRINISAFDMFSFYFHFSGGLKKFMTHSVTTSVSALEKSLIQHLKRGEKFRWICVSFFQRRRWNSVQMQRVHVYGWKKALNLQKSVIRAACMCVSTDSTQAQEPVYAPGPRPHLCSQTPHPGRGLILNPQWQRERAERRT